MLEKDALIVNSEFELGKDETIDLYYLIGYLPENISYENLVIKYKFLKDHILSDTMKEWSKDLMTMEVFNSKEEWIKRELVWHNYFFGSCITYDTSLHQHIIYQGCIYQYFIGG